MNRLLLIFTVVLIGTLMGCTKDNNIDPTIQLDSYINSWQSHSFTEMYGKLSDKSKDKYTSEEFIDRYEKIYDDLNIRDLKITYTALTNDEIKKAYEEESISIPLQLSMESIAGEITFSSVLKLQLVPINQNEEKIKEWVIDWNPGLIFPDLEDGGIIKVEKERPRRGEILDRNQMPLAINDIAYEIGIVPERFQNKDAEIEQIARLLNISTQTILTKLEASWVQPEFFVPIRIIPIFQEDTLRQLMNIPAITTRETIGRTYPSDKAIAHLVGYVGQITSEELADYPPGTYQETDLIGKRGLEKIYEDSLRGKEGTRILIVQEDENGKEQVKVLAEDPVENGQHIQVTIDINLQEKIYAAYENKLSGTTSAIDPKTGEILALVSSPSYDPNELVYGVTQARWDALIGDANHPFVNRFTATYAPGSVLKPIIAAIGLSSGAITHDEGIEINGLTWKKSNWKDFKISRVSTSNGPVDVKDAITRSDNIYFAMKAIQIGSDPLESGLKEFGFNQKIPINYPFATSQISNSNKLKDEVLRANTGYGQGEIEVTSLHMALLYSAFLNEGNMIKPVLLADDTKGEFWKENLLNKADADKMKTYLRSVVTDGTASAINDEKFPIAGKTGTVELKLTKDSIGRENGWFVGYPIEHEQILIAMMIEHVENIGTSGMVAKKVAKIVKEYSK